MRHFFVIAALLTSGVSIAQPRKIQFTEYNLDNGMHVILHQDNTTPIVAVSVLYHVGSKNETPGRTGFAHFFEHLLFEGALPLGRHDHPVAPRMFRSVQGRVGQL